MDEDSMAKRTDEDEEKKKNKGWIAVVVSIVIVVVGTILISMLIAGFHNPGELFAYIGQQHL